MILLAIDPSIRSCGLAVFEDGDLVLATTIKEPSGRTKLPAVERCADMAERALSWLVGKARPTEIAAEWPQIYAPGKGKGNPTKALPGLSGVASAIVLGCRLSPSLKPLKGACAAFSYSPAEWCQGTDKPATGDFKVYEQSARGLRIMSRLTPAELVVWRSHVKTHDAGDAVGIGLNHLGRLKPRRVYARG